MKEISNINIHLYKYKNKKEDIQTINIRISNKKYTSQFKYSMNIYKVIKEPIYTDGNNNIN